MVRIARAAFFVKAMNLLQRYVTRSFIISFLLGMMVLTFVLSIGLLVKATELVVRGLPVSMVGHYLLVSAPQSFTFTVPLAALTGALLVFGRLSSDSEISAMKACGVNTWMVMRPPMLIGVLLSVFSVYVNHEIAPRSHFARRSVNAMVKSGAGLKLLQPGQFIRDFPGMTFWFARREDNVLHDLLIFDKTKDNSNREIRAESALVEVRGDDIWLDMRHVRIEPFSDTQPGAVTADRLTHVIPGAMMERPYNPKMTSLRHGELKRHVAALQREAEILRADNHRKPRERDLALRDIQERTSQARTEFHRRFALGLAPLVFILLGMPLGIQSHRRESNVGIGISMAVMVLYYAFLIIADALAKRPNLYPHLLVWLPTLVCGILAVFLIRRNR